MSYFFFQAEDGIRYVAVTGVQTCALPICSRLAVIRSDREPRRGVAPITANREPRVARHSLRSSRILPGDVTRLEWVWHRSTRSEERRVGKEGGKRCEGDG